MVNAFNTTALLQAAAKDKDWALESVKIPKIIAKPTILLLQIVRNASKDSILISLDIALSTPIVVLLSGVSTVSASEFLKTVWPSIKSDSVLFVRTLTIGYSMASAFSSRGAKRTNISIL
jgi:hypothetical protein